MDPWYHTPRHQEALELICAYLLDQGANCTIKTLYVRDYMVSILWNYKFTDRRMHFTHNNMIYYNGWNMHFHNFHGSCPSNKSTSWTLIFRFFLHYGWHLIRNVSQCHGIFIKTDICIGEYGVFLHVYTIPHCHIAWGEKNHSRDTTHHGIDTFTPINGDKTTSLCKRSFVSTLSKPQT